ncbi:hypothetical protein HYH03_011506 [Edaphochlamys debaryana]|uniref:Cyclin N-terminal domain-containing protein n=1 Tax=Edaphochlamys debaryana TaxID=47281 RepID=A0A835XX81_9CHLO|nr:hypothetical protein HYH03_011506 [Edaphochlamys debaryana]|eukprot:KAG2490041.1 hypothetical protein HYH03_011506 [Edaphochlamys debaryana]
MCKPQCSGLFGGREEEERLFGGLRGECPMRPGSCSSLPSSGSDAASLDSETSNWNQTSCSMKSFEEPCCLPGSPSVLCEEDDALDIDDEDATREYAPGRPYVAHSYNHEDDEAQLLNEFTREKELPVSHPVPIPNEYRTILTRWMWDVCRARALSPATFFAAVGLLDRFLRAAGEGATPPTLLQLVSLTSVGLAAKSEQQQCAAELLSMAKDEHGQLYRAEDARKMEFQMLHLLEWRLRTPTVYSFTQLLLHRLVHRPQDGAVVPPGQELTFRALVLRLAEIAVMDPALSTVPYSTLAVACVLVAETELKGGQGADLKTVHAVRSIPGAPDLSNLSGPVEQLYIAYKTQFA